MSTHVRSFLYLYLLGKDHNIKCMYLSLNTDIDIINIKITLQSILCSGKGDKSRKLAPFRPSYGQLGELRSLVEKKVPVIALTATATQQTREIIMKDLSMENCTQIIVDPNKKNVKYSVENGCKEICDNFKWLLEMLASTGPECPRSIVFFRQIKHIVEVFEFLQTKLGDKQYVNSEENDKNGYWNRLFAMFHLTTNEKIKRAVCESFQDPSGLVTVVLCSTSFSMGLDVRSVHTVVHFGPAHDLDDYLQESGRAGRNPSVKCNAVLLRYKNCLSSQNISKEMKEFVKRSDCRRLALLKPFSENSQSLQPAHDCCDNCTVNCHCLCRCTSVCNCEVLCSSTESTILTHIRNALATQMKDEESYSSENEDFSSGSDIEEYIRKKPQVIDSSEEND